MIADTSVFRHIYQKGVSQFLPIGQIGIGTCDIDVYVLYQLQTVYRLWKEVTICISSRKNVIHSILLQSALDISVQSFIVEILFIVDILEIQTRYLCLVDAFR